jgi:hypothetical protein
LADSVGAQVMLRVIARQGWETLTEDCEHDSEID